MKFRTVTFSFLIPSHHVRVLVVRGRHRVGEVFLRKTHQLPVLPCPTSITAIPPCPFEGLGTVASIVWQTSSRWHPEWGFDDLIELLDSGSRRKIPVTTAWLAFPTASSEYALPVIFTPDPLPLVCPIWKATAWTSVVFRVYWTPLREMPTPMWLGLIPLPSKQVTPFYPSSGSLVIGLVSLGDGCPDDVSEKPSAIRVSAFISTSGNSLWWRSARDRIPRQALGLK